MLAISIELFLVTLLQVMMKDLVTPIPPEEIYSVVKKCLENAALLNYTKVTEMAKAEGKFRRYFHKKCAVFIIDNIR